MPDSSARPVMLSAAWLCPTRQIEDRLRPGPVFSGKWSQSRKKWARSPGSLCSHPFPSRENEGVRGLTAQVRCSDYIRRLDEYLASLPPLMRLPPPERPPVAFGLQLSPGASVLPLQSIARLPAEILRPAWRPRPRLPRSAAFQGKATWPWLTPPRPPDPVPGHASG